MKYARMVILAIVLPWSGLSGFWAEMASAREPGKVTGHVWVQLTDAEKFAYLDGILDAGITRSPNGILIELTEPDRPTRLVRTKRALDRLFLNTETLDQQVIIWMIIGSKQLRDQVDAEMRSQE